MRLIELAGLDLVWRSLWGEGHSEEPIVFLCVESGTGKVFALAAVLIKQGGAGDILAVRIMIFDGEAVNELLRIGAKRVT